MEYQSSEHAGDLMNFTDVPLAIGVGGSIQDLVETDDFSRPVEWTDDEAHPCEGRVALPLDGWHPRELAVIEDEVVVLEEPASTRIAVAQEAEPETSEEVEDYPSVSKIVRFTLPAIGVWLCSPVLSMIDTASVGLLAGTAQQAALNPAVSVTDYGALLVAFMYTATTNLVAGAQEKDLAEGVGGTQERTKKTMRTALRLALVVGVSFGTVLGVAAPVLLRGLIGNASLDPEVFGAALRYVQVRSLGMPAAVVIGTAQSACLGMKDVKSPLLVLAAAAGINLLADIVLVRNAHPWLGGAAGAAWATVLSQYGALYMFMRWLTREKAEASPDYEPVESVGKKINAALRKPFALRRKLSKSKAPKIENKNPAPARGFLSSRSPLAVLNPFRLTRKAASKFAPFVVPVTTTSVGRVSGFLTMSHVASSAFGTLDMAAHQIAISIFCCLAPVVDALNQVAQSFVPGIFARKKSKARARALRRTSVNFVRVGALFGSAIAAGIVLGVPILSRFFTTDAAVLSRVRRAVPGMAVFLGFDGLMCVAEGTLLGQQDLSFLRNMYAAFFFLVPAFMLRLKRRALSGVEVGIGTMWGTFSVYEVVRTVLWLGRLVRLQRKTEKEVEATE